MKMKLLALAMVWCGATVFAQDYFPKNDGVKTTNNNYTAFTNATIHVTPGQVLENATLLIQDGKVKGVGKNVSIPGNTVQVDLKGKSIYPSFIDVFSDFGVDTPKPLENRGRSPQYDATREGFYWNDHIMPENNAIAIFKFDGKKAEELRKAGFGVVNSHIQDGIARGTGALITLKGEGTNAERVLDDRSAQYFSFEKSVAKEQSYPTSLMGAMALLRQMYHDMDWYAGKNAETTDRSLEALIRNRGLVQVFAAQDNGQVLRADKIGDAFGIQYVILASGAEYENIDDIKAANAPLIVPLDFPEAYDVADPYQAGYIALKDMRHWNLAPTNPKVLADNGLTYSFTLKGLESPADLMEKVNKSNKIWAHEGKSPGSSNHSTGTNTGQSRSDRIP